MVEHVTDAAGRPILAFVVKQLRTSEMVRLRVVSQTVDDKPIHYPGRAFRTGYGEILTPPPLVPPNSLGSIHGRGPDLLWARSIDLATQVARGVNGRPTWR